MKQIKLIISFLLFCATISAQIKSNLHEKIIQLNSDTISIDTLSLVPNSVFLFNENGNIISDSLYKIDYAKALIIPSKSIKNTNAKITFRTFDFNFSKEYFHKNKPEPKLKNIDEEYFSFKYRQQKNNNLPTEQLTKNGSISRGITFGNSQDVGVNSNLNLQIAGKLSDDINIIAAISDNNIPIQPDGNTQQIQDFDKVFITLFNEKYRLTLGDFEIKKPKGYFLNTSKKVQGIVGSTSFVNEKTKISVNSTLSGAVTKGKYCRKPITAKEGNQGPYKIYGCENEIYIVILSGTEKVYVDGKLQIRGEENDYTIDYNTAELTFTAKQVITKDKRIVIEFEYSDKNFARFMLFNSNEIKTKNAEYWVNIYSESDSKNQPIQQDLSTENKELLSSIGDNLNMAFVPNIDSVAFTNDLILYQKIDTVVNSTTFADVYVYSTNAENAFYKLGFAYVGTNLGNYVQSISTANGKVYKWISPENGIPQGSYEPVVLLVTPKKKQMLSIGGTNKISKNTSSRFEFSASNNDLNTFSTLNNSDDNGYALLVEFLQKFPLADSNKTVLNTSAKYRFVQKNFSPIEQFNDVEFSRNWNLASSTQTNNEHLLNFKADFVKQKTANVVYNLDYMLREQTFNGINNRLNGRYSKNGFELLMNGSFLNSTSDVNKTQFLRHNASVSKSIKSVKIGLREDAENNSWKKLNSDTLENNSYKFQTFEVFAQTEDTLKNRFIASYKNRRDYLPKQNQLSYNSLGEDFSLGMTFNKSKFNDLQLTSNYRKLTLKDSLQQDLKPENSITARFDDNFRLWKGAVVSSTNYELGSGLEIKKEYVYVEVATGQGSYKWTDYNSNNIKEIDEFDLVTDRLFQDQANYIRVYTPTNESIKTFSTQFNQVLNVNPIKIWNNAKSVKKFITKFSNQFAYNVKRKTQSDNILSSLNPFNNSLDTMLVSTSVSVRNTFSFNKTNSKYGIDYIFQNNKNRILMINGLETRTNNTNGLRLRWNILPKLSLIDFSNYGFKTYKSEFLASKNYNLELINNEANLSFQPDVNMQFSLIHQYLQKTNSTGLEQSKSNKIGVEFRYSSKKEANLSASVNYINIVFNADGNSSLAYEMLEGLTAGNNITWVMMFQKNLANNLQLIVNYNGRKSGENKIVHSGGMQLRAFF